MLLDLVILETLETEIIYTSTFGNMNNGMNTRMNGTSGFGANSAQMTGFVYEEHNIEDEIDFDDPNGMRNDSNYKGYNGYDDNNGDNDYDGGYDEIHDPDNYNNNNSNNNGNTNGYYDDPYQNFDNDVSIETENNGNSDNNNNGLILNTTNSNTIRTNTLQGPTKRRKANTRNAVNTQNTAIKTTTRRKEIIEIESSPMSDMHLSELERLINQIHVFDLDLLKVHTAIMNVNQ